jgi:tRNA:m4X modification enzyme
MSVAKGKEYCGEHDKSSEDGNPDAKRIPCPLDPKHTVYSHKLEKHLKICNARPKEHTPKYIKKGINLCDPQADLSEPDPEKFSLQDLSEDELNLAIEKINFFYKTYVEGKIGKLDYQHDHQELKDELANPAYGQSTLKHLVQTSAILGIMNHLEFLKSDTCYIEYGAGKGGVAYWLARSIENFESSKVLLLDRTSHRHKKDNKIENRDLVKRILCDIADFDLKNFEEIGSCSQFIAVSKHLCGVATDLAIRCILNGNESKKLKTNGFLIALCCHHKSVWKEYVGQTFFMENGIDERMFQVFSKIVSWGICGTGMSREKRKELESKGEHDRFKIPFILNKNL